MKTSNKDIIRAYLHHFKTWSGDPRKELAYIFAQLKRPIVLRGYPELAKAKHTSKGTIHLAVC
jgi:hypothetical protein